MRGALESHRPVDRLQTVVFGARSLAGIVTESSSNEAASSGTLANTGTMWDNSNDIGTMWDDSNDIGTVWDNSNDIGPPSRTTRTISAPCGTTRTPVPFVPGITPTSDFTVAFWENDASDSSSPATRCPLSSCFGTAFGMSCVEVARCAPKDAGRRPSSIVG